MRFPYDNTYMERELPLRRYFPRYTQSAFLAAFGKGRTVRERNPHERLLVTAQELAEGGYERLLAEFGFHDKYKTFSGHCHQMTPALGAVLLARGFRKTYHLECARMDNDTWEFIHPRHEEDPGKRPEFCRIGYIPYCALEVWINGKPYFLSPKHLGFERGEPAPRLAATSYKRLGKGEVVGHPDDASQSGIYFPKLHGNVWAAVPFPMKHSFRWVKEPRPSEGKVEEKETFVAFRRIQLIP